jgi:hypothetical protein
MTRTPRTPRLNDLRALSSRVNQNISRKTLVYAGAGLALAGTGAAVATGFAGGAASAAGTESLHKAVAVAAPHHDASTANHAAVVVKHAEAAKHAKPAPAKAAPAKHAPAAHAAKPAAAKHAAAPAKAKDTTVKHVVVKKDAGKAAVAKPVAKPAAKHPAAPHVETWAAASRTIARRTTPGVSHHALPAQDRLTPVGTTGPQEWMPLNAAQYENAKTIVAQALAKHMGVRSAVIAVATSMQEAGLVNIHYGTYDSLGLFQQRPSCGWGTATQIMHPAYAADAFLSALQRYQANDPAWAHQPLYQSAQGVQGSAFPTAYAKWEAQAAHLVATIAPRLV